MISPSKTSCAFSLIEVTLALGVASFALVAILGLLPIGLSATQRTVKNTSASLLSEEIASDVRVTAARNGMGGTSDFYKVHLKSNEMTKIWLDRNGLPLASGDPSGAAMAALVKVSGQVVSRLSEGGEYAPVYHATVRVWWPAAASEANAQGLIELPFTIRPQS